MDVANLEPNILLSQWGRRGIDNIFEALQIVSEVRLCYDRFDVKYLETLSIFLLLLVYDTESEVYLVCFLKVRLHSHHM
jgi:hypothetical protein